MHITLSPIRSDAMLTLERRGDTLVINGEAFDFSDLPEGAMLPEGAVACNWLAGPVARRDGVLHLTLALPHGREAPREVLFPAPLTLTEDGPVALYPAR